MSSERTRAQEPSGLVRRQSLSATAASGPPRWLVPAVVALGYAAYAIFLTWPLASDPSGQLGGSTLIGDLAGSVASVGYVVSHHVFPFAPATLHLLNAPQGLPQPWVDNLGSFPGTALVDGLGYVFGAVAGSAVFLWLGFVLSGLSMFLLTRRLFGSTAAAVLAGFAFAFYPYAVDKLGGHAVYMDGWVLVLAVWRMLEMIERPTARNALLAGAATAVAMWFTFYFILIGGVAFLTLTIVALVVGKVRRERPIGLGTVLGASLPVILLLVGLGALAVLAGGVQSGTLRTQSIQDLYKYSARPLEWLLPDRHNLIFGGLTGGYLTRHLHGSNFAESSLYLGLSVLGLASAGLVLAVRSLRSRGRAAARDPAVVAALAGGALALVAAWFSAPPTVHILGFPVATPSSLVYLLTSTWRVYARFVELLELGLCILLAFTVSRLLARCGPRRAAVVITLLGLVLAVDLWARPANRTISIATPPEYVWLREHPGGIVADYPIQLAGSPDYRPQFWQLSDGHPLLQGYGIGSTAESLKLRVMDLREPGTAGYLAAFGVRYIVVHPGVRGGTLATVHAQHYAVRFSSPSGSVWQVRAEPAGTQVGLLENFSYPEGPPGAEYRWMTGTGVLALSARGCGSCRGTLAFRSTSSAVARTLTVSEGARVLARVRIPAGRTVNVIVPRVTLSRGAGRLVLSTDIGPTIYRPGVDSRPLSVSVQEPRLRLAG